ncbi:MAG: DUF3649 domain-containing protein [Pseudomonadota bacterium]
MTSVMVNLIPKWLYYYPRFSRVMAALVGAYIFANVISLLLFFAFVDNHLLHVETETINRELVTSGFNAATAASMLSIVIYTMAAIWVFYAKTATRAWAVMLLPSLLGIGCIYLLLPDSVKQVVGG